jgi:surfeit locus 1 family protein
VIDRIRAAGLVWPTVMTLAALPILIGLGTWQLQRKAWKDDLIARVAAGATAAPVALDAVLADAGANREFRRVRVRGQFDHAHEFHVWAPRARDPAWLVVTPLRLEAPVQSVQTVLVMRGIVAQPAKDASVRMPGQPAGTVEIVGRTRLASRAQFASHDAAANQWFSLDLPAMQQALAKGGRSTGPALAPVFIEAEAASGPLPAPQPDPQAVNLSSRHLEYALTWFALALTLIGVYFAFARSRLNADQVK